MKPFDLKAALAGKLVVTSGGRKVTQLTKFEGATKYPLVGLIEGDLEPSTFSIEGSFIEGENSSEYDLFMAMTKREAWFNLYEGHFPGFSRENLALRAGTGMYATEAKARAAHDAVWFDGVREHKYLATVRIEWEE